MWKQRIILDVEFDPESEGSPAEWNWNEICDTSSTKVVAELGYQVDVGNMHDINPATGEQWPIEPNCCSVHFPVGGSK